VQKRTLGEVELMASCVRNICTENYLNLIIGFQATVENVGVNERYPCKKWLFILCWLV